MPSIILKNVSKTFDKNITAIKDFSFASDENEFIVIVGSSGCGKSTLLRAIAGFEKLTAGHIYLNNTDISDYEPKDREVSMVFQNYALYPHMSVYENIAFPLKMKKEDKSFIHDKVHQMANMLEISELLDRKPHTLSGGQKQRVAIGRALIKEPQILLLDEPLSNLDSDLREKMRTEMIKLHKKLNSVIVYVTHDQIEAMSLGERIIVMDKGEIMQIGTPKDIYNKPANQFVAGFIGTPKINYISSDTAKKLCCDLKNVNDEVIIAIRPEHINITYENKNNYMQGEITFIELLGKENNIHIKTQHDEFIVSSNKLDYKVGDLVFCYSDLNKFHFFDKETKQRIDINQ